MRSWVEAEKALSPTDFEAQIEFKRQAKQAFTPLIDFQALMEDPEVVEGLMDPQVRATLSLNSARPRASFYSVALTREATDMTSQLSALLSVGL